MEAFSRQGRCECAVQPGRDVSKRIGSGPRSGAGNPVVSGCGRQRECAGGVSTRADVREGMGRSAEFQFSVDVDPEIGGGGRCGRRESDGLLYDEGYGVQKDAKQAAYYYRLAAEKGNVDAEFSLGLAYEKGSGVRKDNAEAAKWLKMSAQQGNTKAQAELDVLQQKDQLTKK